MGGELPLGAEFLRGGNDTDAKDFFPETVGGDARCERVVLMQDPLRQIHAVRGFVGRGETLGAESLNKAGTDFGPVAEVRAAQVHVGLTAFVIRAFLHHGDCRVRFKLFEGLFSAGEFLALGGKGGFIQEVVVVDEFCLLGAALSGGGIEGA